MALRRVMEGQLKRPDVDYLEKKKKFAQQFMSIAAEVIESC
ncbi:MAG: hypothetical protein RIC15_04065 [Vicingaceae bacterium]